MAGGIPVTSLRFLIILTFISLLGNSGAAMSSWRDDPEMQTELNQANHGAAILHGLGEHLRQFSAQPVPCTQRDGAASLEQFANNFKSCIDPSAALQQLQRNISGSERLDSGYLYRQLCGIVSEVALPCFNAFVKSIDNCWGLGQNGIQLRIFISETVHYFCGRDNTAVNIISLAENDGGPCLKEHQTGFVHCLQSKSESSIEQSEFLLFNLAKIYDPSSRQESADYCVVLGNAHECTFREFSQCNNPTPEIVMQSWLTHLERAMECNVPVPAVFSGGKAKFAVNLLVFLPVFFILF